jgi:hypothetical protein
MTARKISGLILKPTLSYVRKTWGDAGLNQCLNELDFDIHPNKISNDSWYDWDSTDRNIMKWIAEEKGLQYVERSAMHRITSISKLILYLIRLTKIESILKQFPKRYSDMYNFGQVDLDIKKNKAILTVKDWPEDALDDFHHLNWIGALKGVLDITHTKGIVEKVKCPLKGDSHCEYLISWESKKGEDDIKPRPLS